MGLTQEELAARIGDQVRQAEISRLENDRVLLPRRERMERIAEVLQVPLGELLARSGWAGAEESLSEDAHQRVPQDIDPETALVVLDKLSQVEELVEEVKAMVDPEGKLDDHSLAGTTEAQVADAPVRPMRLLSAPVPGSSTVAKHQPLKSVRQ
jgi:transcriptional regulator with XRE-family HTH domain